MTMRLLYISASQFSGTTLASFLLNTHSQIATIGHSMGWAFSENEEFLCSCGQPLNTCKLFTHVATRFKDSGLVFNPQDFGTQIKLADNPTINSFLTDTLPYISSNAIDLIRDAVVHATPRFQRRLHAQLKANRILFSAITEAMNATIYLDNSHSPYRAIHLSREPSFEVYNIHLVRDPRAVAYSMRKNSNIPLERGAKTWIKRQVDIFRISKRLPRYLLLRYEELVADTNTALASIHEFVGIPYEEFKGNFKTTEHHILGNNMRFKNGEIEQDTSWRHKLTSEEIQSLNILLSKYHSTHKHLPIGKLLEGYLQN